MRPKTTRFPTNILYTTMDRKVFGVACRAPLASSTRIRSLQASLLITFGDISYYFLIILFFHDLFSFVELTSFISVTHDSIITQLKFFTPEGEFIVQ